MINMERWLKETTNVESHKIFSMVAITQIHKKVYFDKLIYVQLWKHATHKDIAEENISW